MKATITSKGQITIPVGIRRRLRLKAGDVLEFEEDATVLTARRVIDPAEWDRGLKKLRTLWRQGDSAHPWQDMNTRDILNETRGPVELPPVGDGEDIDPT